MKAATAASDVLGQHSAAIVNGLQQKHSLALNLGLCSDLDIAGGDGEGNVINAGSGSEVSLCCVRCLVGKHSNHRHVLAWKARTFNHRRSNFGKELKPQW